MKTLFLTTPDAGRRTQSCLFPRSPSSLHPLLPSSWRPLSGRHNPAFTLIETALAMLAIGLGLIAIFGLGRLGLQNVKETQTDERCVQMADAIFETLREYNTRFVEAARADTDKSWTYYWNQTTKNEFNIPFPPVANMSRSDNVFLLFTGTEHLALAYDVNAIYLSDWNPRYMLYLKDKYDSRVANGINLKQITLVIYPDGDTYSSEYRIFHTTLTDTGGLP